ncbi:MAG: iron ABC transporter permease [Phycisphaeraceae bacterium]|nr:iron ABC transporter permease [Phycisphaeraceae bacterium]
MSREPESRSHAEQVPALQRWRGVIGISTLVALFVGVIVARALIGRGATGVHFGWPEEWDILRLRATAASSAAIAGAALGVSGLLLQNLLRNPLASPFILGLSAGAGLGMTVATWLATLSPAAAWLMAGGALLPATAGALASLALVVALGQRRGVIEPLTLVLAGVIVSALASALALLIQHLLPFEARGRIDAWMLGRIPEVSPGLVAWCSGGVTVIGVFLAVRLGRAMDAASLSDAEAISVGVDLPRLRLALLTVAAALAAAATALCGPLAFVGLVAPHMARLLCGARHGSLVVGSAVAGITLLAGADVVRQAIDFGAGRLPIGVVTAILGSIAFLWLLRRFRPGGGP